MKIIDPGYIGVLSDESDVLLPAVIKVAIKKHGTNERTNMLQTEPSRNVYKEFRVLDLLICPEDYVRPQYIAAYITYFTRK